MFHMCEPREMLSRIFLLKNENIAKSRTQEHARFATSRSNAFEIFIIETPKHFFDCFMKFT